MSQAEHNTKQVLLVSKPMTLHHLQMAHMNQESQLACFLWAVHSSYSYHQSDELGLFLMITATLDASSDLP